LILLSFSEQPQTTPLTTVKAIDDKVLKLVATTTYSLDPTLSLKKKNTLIASCPKGLEPALQSDIEALGFSIVKIAPRAVYFVTDEVGFYRAHLGLRTASSIKLQLKTFECEGTGDLFSRCEKISWEKLLPKDVAINVQIQVSKDYNPKEVFEVFKRGIEARFLVRSGSTPEFAPKEDAAEVFVYQYNSQFCTSADTGPKVTLPPSKRTLRQAYCAWAGTRARRLC